MKSSSNLDWFAITGVVVLLLCAVVAQWRRRRVPSPIEQLLRASIGREAVLGVYTSNRTLGEFNGRIEDVNDDRVFVTLTRRPDVMFDSAQVGRHSADWGIRIADVSWLRIGELELTEAAGPHSRRLYMWVAVAVSVVFLLGEVVTRV